MLAVLVPSPVPTVQFISSEKKKKKLTAPWTSFHLAIPNWHYRIQFGKGKTKTKPVCQTLTQEIEWAKHCDACRAAHVGARDERRMTCASLTRSSSSQLKSVSAGRQSYFWRVSDTNTTIKPTPWQILTNAAEHLNHIVPAAYIFVFSRRAAAQTCCLWFNNKNMAGNAAISRIQRDLYGYEVNTEHFLPPTFISCLGSAMHHTVHLLHTGKIQFPHGKHIRLMKWYKVHRRSHEGTKEDIYN